MNSDHGSTSRATLLAMALVSGAVLLYEITLTRVLSTVIWYHFAFLAVSLAMLGLGAPGVWFSLRPPRETTAWKLLIGAGIAIPLSIFLIVRVLARIGIATGSADDSLIDPMAAMFLKVTGIVASVLVPLLLLGGVICLFLMAATGRRVGRMYGADLLGAALGAALVVPLMRVFPTPSILAACGFLPLGAAVLIRRERRWVPLTMAVLLVAILAWGGPFTLRYNKGYDETAYDLLHEKWTPIARLTVFQGIFFTPEPELAFGWGMGTAFRGTSVEQLWIEQDGSAGTPITRLPGAPDSLEFLLYDVTSAAYQLRPPETVCIIGAGGGRDILTSLMVGAHSVDAVELNPYIIKMVSERYGDFSGDPYHFPQVRAFGREGRSFLTETDSRYDLLQISLIDSWAATAAGAYALSENYLYTVEAMELYWNRLAPDGIATISRWMLGEGRMEIPRLALLAQEALLRQGVKSPLDHLAVVQSGLVGNLLVSKTPFTEEDLARLDAIAVTRGFRRQWPLPDGAGTEGLLHHVLQWGPARLTSWGFHLDPPTDDRPFFFQTVRAFSSIPEEMSASLSINEEAALLPRSLVLAVGAISLALFFSPFLWRRQEGGAPWNGSSYFVAVGLGFLLVEVPFLQRFVLYLGHPSYATTVVLSTLLLGSGLGSLAASGLPSRRVHGLRFLLPVGIAAVTLALGPVFESSLGWPLPGRVVVSVALLAPLGFLMGIPFPTGMIRFGQESRAWFWALNGAAGVMASVSAVVLASYVGLNGVVWIGTGCYVVACLLLPRPAVPGEST